MMITYHFKFSACGTELIEIEWDGEVEHPFTTTNEIDRTQPVFYLMYEQTLIVGSNETIFTAQEAFEAAGLEPFIVTGKVRMIEG